MIGHFDALKERAIGVELFKRPPSYDTGEDAIVRVTASDVRKRLSDYYLRTSESSSNLRINLPVGSYIPEFTRDTPDFPSAVDQPLAEAASTPEAHSETNSDSPVQPLKVLKLRTTWIVASCLLICAFSLWVFHRGAPAQPIRSTSALPWSTVFAEKHTPLLVTSDPNIAEIQGLTGKTVSVSDYANQQYVPDASSLPPEILHICRDILRGDKAATVDTQIIAGVARLGAENETRINVRAARDLHFSDLDTDDDLIFLGSPRTDPWTSLFDDQLDFRFVYDAASRQEIIQNVHPHSGEPLQYIPTAKGFATGQSFATISFIQKTNHAGHVLILAGENAEGTKAAGELVTDPLNLSSALKRCSIHPSFITSNTAQQFQILIHLRMMAGLPTAFDVVACHLLP
ncbi:hypothetical protein [Edaphobacter albus]|uniref:hypothetical protein n=1 Tax=Edaphobacter sp. 4G125 TaxID=2763071 RepID=UPI001648F22B|nr:hypothetical protein [Edaphobacter sp. 4G125]QNI37983.1 hypothetical protein H7846_06900 [Edaphobacter sp. 4G125]